LQEETFWTEEHATKLPKLHIWQRLDTGVQPNKRSQLQSGVLHAEKSLLAVPVVPSALSSLLKWRPNGYETSAMIASGIALAFSRKAADVGKEPSASMPGHRAEPCKSELSAMVDLPEHMDHWFRESSPRNEPILITCALPRRESRKPEMPSPVRHTSSPFTIGRHLTTGLCCLSVGSES
jgi:hypothetical protein